MKKNVVYIKIILLAVFFSVLPFASFAQTESQKKEILAQYDLAKIKALQQEFTQKAKAEKEKTLAAARANQWEIY